jgi:acyl-CoA synthetase (NDP forming)
MPVAEFDVLLKRYSDKTIVVSLLGDLLNFAPTLSELTRAGICAYLTPEDGAMALNALLARRHILERDQTQ